VVIIAAVDSDSDNSGRCSRQGHIALNAQLLSPAAGYRNAGVSQYILALLRSLPAACPDFTLTAFVGAGVSDSFAGWRVRRSALPGDSPPLRILWEQGLQPGALLSQRVDLVHAPVNVGPLLRPCRMVTTVHDLAFLRYPETFRPLHRLYQRTMARWTARHADAVIAVSESTRADCIRFFGVPPAKVVTVPNGVLADFRPLPREQVEAFRRARGLPERFLLSVATMEPRKNLPRLLEALARVPAAPPLYLVGGRGWYHDSVDQAIARLGLEGRVHLAGYVPHAELPLWYNAASWLVYPSLYEGFGLPALEALACGTPCIVSAASSLPEVVGDAALLVDPLDVQALAEALRHTLGEPDLEASLRAAGPRRAALFSWSRTATETAAVYRAVLEGRRRHA
jgi:glycosyltransferase involved in cell wall biosynthesis